MSINSLAAIVSDNDGSAFVTKAEFEAMKDDFAEQVVNYNTSIDGKIDGAIAAYLAGIANNRKNVKTLLTASGSYGNKLILWNSATNYVWDNQTAKYANLIYDITDFDFDYAKDLASRTWTENTLYYMGYLRGRGEHVGQTSLDAVTYTTSKKVKFKHADGTVEYVYERKKMYTSVYLSMSQWTPYRNAPTVTYWDMGGPQSVLQSNTSQMKQDVKNLYVDTFSFNRSKPAWRIDPTFDWAFTGTVSIASTELDNDWDYELLCPKSTAADYYWDPEDKTSNVTLGSMGAVDLSDRYTTPLNMIGGSNTTWHLHTDIDSVDFHPKAASYIRIPWCEKEAVCNDMVLLTLKNVNEKNDKIKNGIIIYEIDENGKLTITLSADYVGVAEFYVSKTPTSTWPSGDIISKQITEANKNTNVEFESFTSADKGKYIWMRYLPTDTTKEALCKIVSATILPE